MDWQMILSGWAAAMGTGTFLMVVKVALRQERHSVKINAIETRQAKHSEKIQALEQNALRKARA